MKEYPILFTTEMVRAILDGRKTQTRRVIKPQPEIITDSPNGRVYQWKDCQFVEQGKTLRFPLAEKTILDYGWQAGDRLWVRETWASGLTFNLGHIIIYRADKKCQEDNGRYFPLDEWCDENGIKWKPSIYMPRWVSRITLEVIKIRVERVQEISEKDAKAEGVWPRTWYAPYGKGEEAHKDISGLPGYPDERISYRNGFATFWDSINAKPKPQKQCGVITHYESYPWDGEKEVREYRGKPWYIYPNPWVRAIELKIRRQKGGDA